MIKHYKGIPQTVNPLLSPDGELMDGNGNIIGPSMASPGFGNSNIETSRSDGAITHVYIDPVSGDDANSGLSKDSSLKTLQSFYDNFPMVLENESCYIVNIVNDTASVVTLETSTIRLGQGSHVFKNPISYVGPEMIPTTGVVGDLNPTMDALGVQLVNNAGVVDVAGNRTQLNFTGAGWAPGSLVGSFVRVTDAGVKVIYETPITANGADFVVLETGSFLGLLLPSYNYEIVEPAILITGPAANFGKFNIVNPEIRSFYVNLFPNEVGFAFEKLSFNTILCSAHGASFDRCVLSHTPVSGDVFNLGTYNFKNCIGKHILYLGGSTLNAFMSGKSTEVVTNRAEVVGIVLVGASAKIVIGSIAPGGNSSNVHASYASDLTTAVYGLGIEVVNKGVFICKTYVQGLGTGGSGFKCARGGSAFVGGAEKVSLTGPVGDINLDGTMFNYGTGVGEIDEPAGLNGTATSNLFSIYTNALI